MQDCGLKQLKWSKNVELFLRSYFKEILQHSLKGLFWLKCVDTRSKVKDTVQKDTVKKTKNPWTLTSEFRVKQMVLCATNSAPHTYWCFFCHRSSTCHCMMKSEDQIYKIYNRVSQEYAIMKIWFCNQTQGLLALRQNY